MPYDSASHDVVRAEEYPASEFEHTGGIATDLLVSIIAKNFSPAEMKELAEKIRVESVRRAAFKREHSPLLMDADEYESWQQDHDPSSESV